MNKILILHVSTVMGGAEYSLLELLHNLGNLPVELHMALSSRHILFRQIKDLPIHCHDIFLPYLKKNRTLSSKISAILSVISGSVKIYHVAKRENMSAIYCNTFRSLPYCILVKWFSRIRIVCHCRDRVPSGMIRILMGFMADELIAVSTDICHQLPVKPKTHIIYNGVNPDCFTPTNTPEWLRLKNRLPQKVQLIGNVGQILPWKNQWDYILVAEQLLCNNKNLHFFIVGAVMDTDYLIRLKERIQHSGLESFFTFTGHVDHIIDYLSAFSVILHTAFNEPFGRALIEAGASAKPVIAYGSGGPSEIIINGKTGYLVRNGNIDEMADLTTCLLNNHELNRSMGQAARDHVIHRFNSEDYARNVYQILTHD